MLQFEFNSVWMTCYLFMVAIFATAQAKEISPTEKYENGKAEIRQQYRNAVAAKILKASKVEILILDPKDIKEDPFAEEKNRMLMQPAIGLIKILKKAVLDEKKSKTFLKKLASQIKDGDTRPEDKHIPSYGVRVYKNNTLVFETTCSPKNKNMGFMYPDSGIWIFLGESLAKELAKFSR